MKRPESSKGTVLLDKSQVAANQHTEVRKPAYLSCMAVSFYLVPRWGLDQVGWVRSDSRVWSGT